MNIVLRGEIRNNIPYFYCSIKKDGTLVLKSDKGQEITADTGFSGTVALPEATLKKMGLKPSTVADFRLADGSLVTLPIYWGWVEMGSEVFDTWFIQGDFLLGMELFSIAGERLIFDLDGGRVRLERSRIRGRRARFPSAM